MANNKRNKSVGSFLKRKEDGKRGKRNKENSKENEKETKREEAKEKNKRKRLMNEYQRHRIERAWSKVKKLMREHSKGKKK